MLSLSCTASKLVAVVTALSILSPPPYGKPHLLQGLKLEMGVFAHCELQIEVHEKQVDVFQFEVVLFEVLFCLLLSRMLNTSDKGTTFGDGAARVGMQLRSSPKVSYADEYQLILMLMNPTIPSDPIVQSVPSKSNILVWSCGVKVQEGSTKCLFQLSYLGG
ncbi:hypothetical protein Tco_0340563 [Tanacetum coccineum]